MRIRRAYGYGYGIENYKHSTDADGRECAVYIGFGGSRASDAGWGDKKSMKEEHKRATRTKWHQTEKGGKEGQKMRKRAQKEQNPQGKGNVEVSNVEHGTR